MTEPISPGERFDDPRAWEADEVDGPHIWRTLAYRRTDWQPGSTSIEWTATPEYCFPTAEGAVVQGGLVTALLDAAMGGACWTVLDRDQVFLTADLRTRRVVFCAAEMHDAGGVLLATSRCTQVVLPDAGPFGRHGAADDTGAPPEDARG
jgi:acyl-coenzyme A thioesterase PaaI-like protein